MLGMVVTILRREWVSDKDVYLSLYEKRGPTLA